MGLMNDAASQSRQALVAMEFDATPRGACIARIVARSEGVVSWAFTHLGAADKTIFEFYPTHVKISAISWSGQAMKVLPLSQISYARVGFLKPVGDLICAALLFVLFCAVGYDNMAGLLLGGLGITYLVDYFFSKTIIFQLHCTSGEIVKFQAKRSIIEWCTIDENSALALCDKINNMIIAAHP